MDKLTSDNMDEFETSISLENCALEINSMDEVMDIPAQQLIKTEKTP